MPLPELPRRLFLKRSLQTLGVLLVPTLAPPGCRRPATPATGDAFVLPPRERSVLAAVAEAFVPSGGAFAVGAREVDLAGRIDRALRDEDPAVVSGLRSALWLLELAGPLLSGQLGVFSRLDEAGRERVLAALPLRFGLAREVFAGLKQTCLFFFYCADDAWPGTGYDGPWAGSDASHSARSAHSGRSAGRAP